MANEVRQIYVKYPGKCLGCGKVIEVGERANYVLGLKKLVHLNCKVPEDATPEREEKRAKVFGIYPVLDALSAIYDLGVMKPKALEILEKTGYPVTHATTGNVDFVYRNRDRKTKTFPKLRDAHILKLKEIAGISDNKADLSEYVKKAELQKLQEDFDSKLDAIEQREPVEVIIKQHNQKPINAGTQHKMFPVLLAYISLSQNVWLVGPAGSGKTRGAREVAKHLSLKYYSKSLCRLTPVSHLLGYMDANGKYIRTDFRNAIENGGLFLLDECDAGSPDVLTAFNDALSAAVGDLISFPDKMIKKHKDFVAIAAANTFGEGANRQYVSRLQQDAASLDRFTFLEWGYDEALELHISGDKKWCLRVQAFRKAADSLGIRHIISPRASINGAMALKAGRSMPEVEASLVWKGLEADAIQKIKDKAMQN